MKTIVKLAFPNVGREFVYEFPYDLSRCDREECAYRSFYGQQAPAMFALYGYAPMDVTILADDRVVASYQSCYQETLWHVFFREGGEPWHGRFSHFTTSLYSYRWHKDHDAQLKAAA